jgi:Family of unknown function (DUF5670)
MLAATKAVVCAIVNSYLPPFPPDCRQGCHGCLGPSWDISSHRHEIPLTLPLSKEGVRDMLGLIAAVLLVLWLLGFLAFHVSTGLIHVLLVVGLILLVLHFVGGSRRIA